MPSELLSKTFTGASLSIGLQLLFRCSTFFLNAFCLRYISRTLLGLVNVRLLLLNHTILFFSREPLRRACLNVRQENARDVIQVMWLSVIFGIFWILSLGSFWIWSFEDEQEIDFSQYVAAVWLFCFAAFIELLSEPMYIVSSLNLFVKLRVLVESVSLISQCLFISASLVFFSPRFALIAFGLGHCLRASWCLLGYSVAYKKYLASSDVLQKRCGIISLWSFLPTFQPLNPSLLSTSRQFLAQSLLKQFLTEGERYVMTFLSPFSLADQGVYDVVSNLGSLVARIVFLPVEDHGYLFFCQTLTRNKPRQDVSKLVEAARFLKMFFSISVIISLFILAFGQGYSLLLLKLYGGRLLSEGIGPVLLRTYCVYILFLSLNGSSECFANATMSDDQLNKYNFKMCGFSLIFLIVSYVFTLHLGSVGFVLANCANLGLRALNCLSYTHNYFTAYGMESPIRSILPTFPVFICLLLSFLTTSYSNIHLCCHYSWHYTLAHVSIGAVCFLTSVLVAVMFDPNVQIVYNLAISKLSKFKDN